MKKPLLILFIFISLFAFTSNPPSSSTLTGTISDLNNKEALTGVKIEIEGINTQFYSDLDGNFSIPLPSGTYNITFSMISYDKSYVEGFILKDDNIENMEVKLK